MDRVSAQRFKMIMRKDAIDVFNMYSMKFDYSYSIELYGEEYAHCAPVDSDAVLYNPAVNYFACYDEYCSGCPDYPLNCESCHEFVEILQDINMNPNALDFLEANPRLYNVDYMLENPSTDWKSFSYSIKGYTNEEEHRVKWNEFPSIKHDMQEFDFSDQAIFTYDYNEIKRETEPITSLVFEWFYRPAAIAKWLESNDYESIGSEEYLAMAVKA